MAAVELAGLDVVDRAEVEPLLETATMSSDPWVADAARMLLATSVEQVEALEASPVAIWRAQASLVLAQDMLQDQRNGAAELDTDRFLSRALVALGSVDVGTSVDAALLLTDFWTSVTAGGGDTFDVALGYLSYAAENGDEEQLAEAQRLAVELDNTDS